MTGDVDTCAAHLQLLNDLGGEVIANLQLTELGIRTVLHEVAAGAVLVAHVVGGQSGNGAVGVGSGPSVEHAVTLVRAGIGDGVEVGLELLVVVDILSGNTLPEHREVEALVGQFDVQTPRVVGHRVEDPGLVLLVDDTVTVEVGIL